MRPKIPPVSPLAGYSGTPLPKKLGIKPGSTTGLVGAPEDFEATLGPVPDGAVLRREPRGQADMVILFVRSAKDLARLLPRAAGKAGTGGLWIAWPKKASGVQTDVSEGLVRAEGLAAGLVDYKVCAIDATWSGLKFARRR